MKRKRWHLIIRDFSSMFRKKKKKKRKDLHTISFLVKKSTLREQMKNATKSCSIDCFSIDKQKQKKREKALKEKDLSKNTRRNRSRKKRERTERRRKSMSFF